jgi:hypothetical protein
MSYFPVDDQAAFHPKFVAAGNASIGLWTRAGSWCKANVSGGRVPPEVAALLGTKREARKLVEVGLWEVAEDGAFQFHDWEHQAGNFAPDQEKSRRENDRERQRRKRDRDRKAREEAEASRTDSRDESRDPSRDNERDDQRESDRSHDGVTAPPSPYPSPALSPAVAGEKTTPRKRGTRLDERWVPEDALIAQMRDECPGVDLRAEHRVFVDYWIAQPGQKGVKADWDATWRNWMRRKAADVRPGRAAPPSRGQQREAELLAFATAADPLTDTRQEITS